MPEEAAKTPAVPGQAQAARRLAGGKPKPAAEASALPVKTSDKVVHIVQRLQEDASRHISRKRSFWLPASLALTILVPTLLAAIYYCFIAADQYVSESRFAVRTNEGQAADVLGIVSGMPRATVVSDSYIVADFIASREMVQILEQRLPFREIYANPAADFLTRLASEDTIEELVAYWNRRVDVFFDPAKNTITVRVAAFSPQDAQNVLTVIMEATESLVNDLSARARRDAVRFASAEVARAELRIREARDNMLAFRSENKQFDPAATAEAALSIVGQLEAEQSTLNSQLAALSGYLGEDAPSIQMLRSRIAALQEESDRIQDQIANGEIPDRNAPTPEAGAGEALVGVLAKYQELLLDQEFAEKAYTAALGSLERARAEADRAQSYLAIYVNPNVAEDATYPRRLLAIFVVALLSLVVWSISALGFLSIRDHMR